MATALIQSLVNGINPVVGASRDDLRAGDVVQLDDVGGPANTYAWSIAFAPEDKDRNPSAATLIGNIFGAGPVTFTVDNAGSYLIRLVIDAGLPTQDEQYVRLRYDTFFGDLKLVAAGERRDGTGIIPVDISAKGWADDQNFNLNRLLCLVQHVSASGRIIYVDANRGKDNLAAPNNPAVAEGFADFSTITAAILAAESNAEFNGGIFPSATQPMVVAVRPGFYEEDIEFKPYIHVIGWPSSGGGTGEHPDFDRSVNIRAANTGVAPAELTFTANLPNLGEYCYISNLILENVGATTNALLRKVGEGDVYLVNTELLQNGGGAASQGSGISVERGRAFLEDTRVIQTDTFSHETTAFSVTATAGTSSLLTKGSMFIGPSIGQVDPTQFGGVTALFHSTKFQQIQNAGAGTEFAIRTWSENLILEECELTVDSASAITEAIEANADAAGTPGDLSLTLRRTLLGDTVTGAPGFLGFTIDSTGVGAIAFLRMASSEYGTITQVGAVTRQALTIGTSLFYDNTVSGLLSENVQDAIDEIAGGGGGGAAPSTAPFITHTVAAGLTDNRVLAAGTGTSVLNSGIDDGSISVNLTATGVAAGAYTRTDLTVDAQGRLTLAASGVVTETYSRQMLIPIPPAIIVPPLVVQEFDVINSVTGFTVPVGPGGAPGAPGPLQVFWAVGGPFTAGTFLQVYLAPFGGPIVSIVDPFAGAGYAAAGFDLSFLGGPIAPGVPVGGFLVQPIAQLGFAVPPGVPHMLLFEITYPALQPVGTDGLTVSLTGIV